MIRTLLFSTLYPSGSRPAHGIFVETRLRELLKSGQVQTQVVAPVPWFPLRSKLFGEYALYADTAVFEKRSAVDVHHPRYFLPPKLGMNIAPELMARGALPTIRRLIDDGFDFDLIDAHYYYPDGVAAGIVARQIGKPFVVTARGSDLALLSSYPRPRRMILETAERAAASICVCRDLRDQLTGLGSRPEKVHVMRNGVDLERFTPIDKTVARRHLGLPDGRRLLLSVGRLIELKGHHVAIAALQRLPSGTMLIIAGSGPELENLRRLASRLQVYDRVLFAGQLANDQLKWWYGAADALVLCSSREGWANVLLESMACGTPVIATRGGGSPEVVTQACAGQLMKERTPEALVAAYDKLFATPPEGAAVRAYAADFGWEATTRAQLALFREIVDA